MFSPKIVLVIYIVLSILGLVFYEFFQGAWDVYKVIDTASSVALAVLAFFGYLEFMRQEQKVKIVFYVEHKTIDTQLSLLRKNFTRSEVLGILGLIQKEQNRRFELSFFKNIKNITKFQEIQTGKEQYFVIDMSQKELEQFNV